MDTQICIFIQLLQTGHVPGRSCQEICRNRFLYNIITDHDSVAGIDEAVSAGNELGIEVIPGIELSTYMMTKKKFIY